MYRDQPSLNRRGDLQCDTSLQPPSMQSWDLFADSSHSQLASGDLKSLHDRKVSRCLAEVSPVTGMTHTFVHMINNDHQNHPQRGQHPLEVYYVRLTSSFSSTEVASWTSSETSSETQWSPIAFFSSSQDLLLVCSHVAFSCSFLSFWYKQLLPDCQWTFFYFHYIL